MTDPFERSPFSPAVNTQLRRLLKTSWKAENLIPPKNAGTFAVPSLDSDQQIAFYDPAAAVPDVHATLPFPIRYLEAAISGMQNDFSRAGQSISRSQSAFLSPAGKPWLTFFGTTSGDEFGMPIDVAGDDPDIHSLMVGEGTGNAWKLSEFLRDLRPV